MQPMHDVLHKSREALGHSPHPAVVLLPAGAFVASNLCDAMGLLTGNRAYDDAARVSIGIGLTGAVAAAVTGVHDYSHIPDDAESHGVATTHALGNSVVGSLFTASYLLRDRARQSGRRPSLAARMLSLAGGGLALYTAWLGGVLVENYGEGVEPVMARRRRGHPLEARWPEHEHDHGYGRERLSPDAPLGKHE